MKFKRNIDDVVPIATTLVEKLKPFCDRIEICGSIRRKKRMVGDIEILCIPKKIKIPVTNQISLFEPTKYNEKIIPGLMKTIREYKIIRGDLDKGKMVSFEIPEGIQVDVFTGNILNYGYQKVVRTGPAEYNKNFLFPKLKSQGFYLNGYIIRRGEIIPVPNEVNVYNLIGYPVHDPEFREMIAKSNPRFVYDIV